MPWHTLVQGRRYSVSLTFAELPELPLCVPSLPAGSPTPEGHGCRSQRARVRSDIFVRHPASCRVAPDTSLASRGLAGSLRAIQSRVAHFRTPSRIAFGCKE